MWPASLSKKGYSQQRLWKTLGQRERERWCVCVCVCGGGILQFWDTENLNNLYWLYTCIVAIIMIRNHCSKCCQWSTFLLHIRHAHATASFVCSMISATHTHTERERERWAYTYELRQCLYPNAPPINPYTHKKFSSRAHTHTHRQIKAPFWDLTPTPCLHSFYYTHLHTCFMAQYHLLDYTHTQLYKQARVVAVCGDLQLS